MSEQHLPPLDADLRALLERSRGPMRAPPGAEDRVLARVEAIVLLPPGGGGGGGGAASTAIAPQVGAFRRFLPLAVSFLLGGGIAAGVLRATMHAPPPVVVELPPRVVYVERPASAMPVTAASVAPPPPSSRPTANAASSGEANGLAAERALLDVARHAIEREDGPAALTAIHEHERRFPNGMLVQEREAMAVRALVLLGRRDDARARADRFRGRYPGSVLMPAIESQLGAPEASP